MTYRYVHNLQGDIIAIVDAAGNTVVQYSYGAWGEKKNVTGSMATTLGKYNPFRYRGYVWDEETRMYYLRSRYYYPELHRFIETDSMLDKMHSLGDINLFAYCGNRPVDSVDIDGNKYTTIGPGVDLFELIHSQNEVLGYVDDYLAEQQRIIK